MVGLRAFLEFSHPCVAWDFWAGPCGSLRLCGFICFLCFCAFLWFYLLLALLVVFVFRVLSWAFVFRVLSPDSLQESSILHPPHSPDSQEW